MWSADDLLGKAMKYFGRASEHEHSDDEEFALWMLLGLEFLLRVPLARVHASLLAVPEGESIMHANGFPAKAPKSIPSHTVITRLRAVVQDFTPEREADGTFLMNLRNAELHTGDAALANAGIQVWLPKWFRVASAVAGHLDTDLDDLLDPDVVEQARQLVDEQDKALANEIRNRIRAAEAVFAALQQHEIAARMANVSTVSSVLIEETHCPACKSPVPLLLQPVRRTAERLEGDNIVADVVCVAAVLSCGVCGLNLEGPQECGAAGFPQQFVRTDVESFEERVSAMYDEPDYGND